MGEDRSRGEDDDVSRGITAVGRENREGEVNPGRQGWLPVTMLDLC